MSIDHGHFTGVENWTLDPIIGLSSPEDITMTDKGQGLIINRHHHIQGHFPEVLSG